MTVLEVIQKSSNFLAKRGVDSARLQTELLLAHVLKMARMKLYLNFERKLSEAELDSMRALVKRRSQREPLQHIIGSTSFCGLEMTVNRHVLVPRPETELLAEMGWEFLNLAADILPATTALDFGTGSGCIAIAIASKSPSVRIVALDVSPEALAVAKQNANSHGVSKQIDFLHGDGFKPLSTESRFDLIVSNPPYIPAAEIETLQPEVKDFDPRGALDGGSDGLDFYRLLATHGGNYIKPTGKLMVEFGDGQSPEIKDLFESQKWVVEAVHDDYTRRPRIMVARR